jgi:hypothetical protein
MFGDCAKDYESGSPYLGLGDERAEDEDDIRRDTYLQGDTYQESEEVSQS